LGHDGRASNLAAVAFRGWREVDAARQPLHRDVPAEGQGRFGRIQMTRRLGDKCRKQGQSTPVDIIETLNKEVNAGLADPKIKTRLAELGVWDGVPIPADAMLTVRGLAFAKAINWGTVLAGNDG